MLIKYTAHASFTVASGITFDKDETKEVPKELGDRLISTFIGMFEDVTPKQETKAKVEPKAKPE